MKMKINLAAVLYVLSALIAVGILFGAGACMTGCNTLSEAIGDGVSEYVGDYEEYATAQLAYQVGILLLGRLSDEGVLTDEQWEVVLKIQETAQTYLDQWRASLDRGENRPDMMRFFFEEILPHLDILSKQARLVD